MNQICRNHGTELFNKWSLKITITMKQKPIMKSVEPSRKPRNPRLEAMGFNAKFRISPDVLQFMNLEHLECGELVTIAFAIQFFTLYCRLGGMIEGRCMNFSPVLRELFRDALEEKGIDPSKVKYTEFPGLLISKRASKFLTIQQLKQQPPGVIGRPGNFESLGESIDAIRKTLGANTRDPEYDQRVTDMRTAWICLGLPGWTNANIPDGPIVKIKVYGGDEDPDCCICMEKPKNQVFLPCKHMCCCYNCSQSVSRVQKTCPICREVVIAFQAFDEKKHEVIE